MWKEFIKFGDLEEVSSPELRVFPTSTVTSRGWMATKMGAAPFAPGWASAYRYEFVGGCSLSRHVFISFDQKRFAAPLSTILQDLCSARRPCWSPQSPR